MASGVPTGNSGEAVKCRTRLKELNDQYYNDGWTFTTLSNVTDVTLPNDVYSTADNVGSPYEYTIVGIRNVSENSQIGPLLTTTWSQTYSSYYPAGCVPIAMGQIMNYHKYPSKFNWSGMKDHESTSATCDLIDDIRSVLGMTGNEANYYDALQGFLTYGYKASLIEHNITDVINELNYKRPVYMRGNDSGASIGHAWVCDGLLHTSTDHTYYIEYLNSVNEYTNYGITLITNPGICGHTSHYDFHMNWGWGDSQLNGWYINPTP